MPERGFDTGFWGDKFVRALEPFGKYLFAYLWTNDHCNQAGVYELGLDTIAFETGLPEPSLPALLESLAPKVKWLPQDNLIWVKNFIAHQAKSPKFLVAAAKCLKKIRNNGLVAEVVEYNLTRHSISIPYQYTTDSVSIHSASVSVSRSSSSSVSKVEEVVKGKPIPEEAQGLDEKTAGLLRLAHCLKHWRTTPDDVEWLQGFLQEFPEFSRDMMTACTDYYSDRPEARHKGDWKNRLRNWARKERQFAAERRDTGKHEFERRDETGGTKGVRPKPQQARLHPIRRIPGD